MTTYETIGRKEQCRSAEMLSIHRVYFPFIKLLYEIMTLNS